MDVDNFVSGIQDMIGDAFNQRKKALTLRSTRWKFCVALASDGWKAIDSKRVGKADIMVTWAKEGKENVEIRLNVIEQGLWIDYLQRKEKNK